MGTHFMQPDIEASRLTKIPRDLPILPLRNILAYPFSVLPLAVGIQRSVKLIEEALQSDRLIGLVAMKDSGVEEPMPGQVYETGTLAIVQRVARASDNTLQVVVQGLERFRIAEWLDTTPYLRARIALAPDVVEADVELEALQHSVRALAQEVVALSPHLPKDMANFLDQIKEPRYLVYLIAANARLALPDGQRLLEMDSVKDKLRLLISHLEHEREVLALGQKIRTEAHEEMDKAQRDYYLRQQLKAIQRELGEADETVALIDEYRQKIETAKLPEEAKQEALRELKRLEGMPPQAAEHAVIKTYLDWLVGLPWNMLSLDQLDETWS
jgi:ATP-dependent Lon protease